MKKIISIIAVAIAVLFTQACTESRPYRVIESREGYLSVELSAVNDCSADAGSDLATAIGDVAAAGGGKVKIPAGCFLIENKIDKQLGISVLGYYGGSMIIEGEAGATALVPNVASTDTAIKLSVTGAVTQSLTLRDFSIVGPDFPDCSPYPAGCPITTTAGNRALELTGTFSQVNVERVALVGVRTTKEPVYLTGGIFSVRDFVAAASIGYEAGVGTRCVFMLDGVVAASIDGFRGFDYGTVPVNGDTIYGNGASAKCWIGHSSGVGGLNGYDDALDTVSIRNAQLDEGPTFGIFSQSITGPGTVRGQRLTIENVRISVNGTTASAGFFIYNQEWVTIKDSLCGYTDLDRYCVKLYNVGHALIDRVATDESTGPNQIYADSNTGFLEVRESEFLCEDITSSASTTKVVENGQEICTP